MILKDRELYYKTAMECAMGAEINGIKYDKIIK